MFRENDFLIYFKWKFKQNVHVSLNEVIKWYIVNKKIKLSKQKGSWLFVDYAIW